MARKAEKIIHYEKKGGRTKNKENKLRRKKKKIMRIKKETTKSI